MLSLKSVNNQYNRILSSTLIELPNGAINLYNEIRRVTKKIADDREMNPEDVIFIQRDLREYSKFKADSIKKYLKLLVDYEYIIIASGKNRGTRYSYKLRKDEPIENIDIDVIPTPEMMEKHIYQLT